MNGVLHPYLDSFVIVYLDDILVYSSTSEEHISHIIIVPKYGTWWMCINYKYLNKNTLQNQYPLPMIDDLLDRLQHIKYFTELDLKSRYHHVRVKEKDT